MKPKIEDIIQKMNDSDNPELSFDFAFMLTNESECGAVLIGAAKVEEFLERLLLSIFPISTKKYTSRLLHYPGSLSSLSGKIELLFAFRIIDEQFYNSLNELRLIRNRAAHESSVFALRNFPFQLSKINSFIGDSNGLISFLAQDNLIKWKRGTIKKILDEKSLDRKIYKEIWKKSTLNLDKHPEVQSQLALWKLSYGLTLMCSYTLTIIDSYLETNKTKIWIEYS